MSAADWAGDALGHVFADMTLLEAALSHSSAGGASYERLEFLGDRVLGLVIADWLMARFPQENEGQISRRFAQLVRKERCADVARAIEAAAHIRLERAARTAKVQESGNVLADVCEALIGALYLDGGFAVAQRFVRQHWEGFITGDAAQDPKSALQEWAQGRGLPLPHYRVTERSGPDHAPMFTLEVSVQGHGLAVATAASKQEAQKKAAALLLDQIGAGA